MALVLWSGRVTPDDVSGVATLSVWLPVKVMRKILVIDDDKSICESLRLYLTEEGYDVGTALTGDDGLKRAATGAWDIIVLDIFLSDVDGLDILRRLKLAVPDA